MEAGWAKSVGSAELASGSMDSNNYHGPFPEAVSGQVASPTPPTTISWFQDFQQASQLEQSAPSLLEENLLLLYSLQQAELSKIGAAEIPLPESSSCSLSTAVNSPGMHSYAGIGSFGLPQAFTDVRRQHQQLMDEAGSAWEWDQFLSYRSGIPAEPPGTSTNSSIVTDGNYSVAIMPENAQESPPSTLLCSNAVWSPRHGGSVECSSDGTMHWRGTVPSCNAYPGQTYSRKVFVGGLPSTMTSTELFNIFMSFGAVRVEWLQTNSRPGAKNTYGVLRGRADAGGCDALDFNEESFGDDHAGFPQEKLRYGKGYAVLRGGFAYVIFGCSADVGRLLTACKQVFRHGDDELCWCQWFYNASSHLQYEREIEVVPWVISDNFFCVREAPDGSTWETRLSSTVYLRGLHGLTTARALATIMDDVFGGVVSTDIHLDGEGYPLGDGRVEFNNKESVMKAVSAEFVHISSQRFNKTVQMYPFLFKARCIGCQRFARGKLFCKDVECFAIFCRPCWDLHHSSPAFKSHVPVTKASCRK